MMNTTIHVRKRGTLTLPAERKDVLTRCPLMCAISLQPFLKSLYNHRVAFC